MLNLQTFRVVVKARNIDRSNSVEEKTEVKMVKANKAEITATGDLQFSVIVPGGARSSDTYEVVRGFAVGTWIDFESTGFNL